ncbi:MAG: hypothetical protein M1832_001503 [Thelocarpon impressellum]|nr:MAG: hypothetical protein M1832_001503 [Thelocarpon impressellum]
MARAWTTWFTGWHWRERILHFTPSWFTVTMGTGMVIQVLVNFPYPAQWLRDLAYVFWILNICLFSLFSAFLVTRFVWFPVLLLNTLDDFSQSNFLGAIPVGFHTIVVGLVAFYGQREAAVRVAYALYWVSVAMTLAVSLGSVSITFTKQRPHHLESVTGVWLLSFVPMVVTSATGASLLPYLKYPENTTVLITSFLMWSLGQSCCLMVLTIYFWRLMAYDVPARDAIVSCFIPLGPLGQGSYAIQGQAKFLSTYIRDTAFQPGPGPGSGSGPLSTETKLAVAEVINWLGIVVGLFLIGHATFWLVEAASCLIVRIPKAFNIGFWSFTFPLGAYANAVSVLARELRNDGLRGWAATCTVAVMLLWVFCAVGTVHKGFWKGELFYAPGLEGWIAEGQKGEKRNDDRPQFKRKQSKAQRHLDDYWAASRAGRDDGTYRITQHRRGAADEEGGGRRQPNGLLEDGMTAAEAVGGGREAGKAHRGEGLNTGQANF